MRLTTMQVTCQPPSVKDVGIQLSPSPSLLWPILSWLLDEQKISGLFIVIRCHVAFTQHSDNDDFTLLPIVPTVGA